MNMQNYDYDRRFAGVARLYGEERLKVFQKSHICIIGIGGVGSWAAESFARNGIGKITLIDMDHIAESNINRQIQALDSTLGSSKIETMLLRLKDINPQISVEVIDDFLDENNIKKYINSNFHYIVDAIDQTKVKISLANFCLKNKISLLMTGGAGGKTNPSQIQIANLEKTFGDPLLSGIRQFFNKQKKIHGISYNIPTVFSPEKITKPINNIDENNLQGLNCAGYGSSVNVTASFAFVAVSFILNNL
tara:strand:- start:2602 stop:3348 length:747 start_codon:yes stop_codon:yes gene_type:complete